MFKIQNFKNFEFGVDIVSKNLPIFFIRQKGSLKWFAVVENIK